MRYRSPVWIALARNGRFHFETKARIGTTEYTAISAPRVDRAVMGTPLTVGGCTSATLNLSILTEDSIASSTPIVILGRLTDGVNNSEWLEFGTFYINQRDTSYNGLITVSCYDAMLKANQTYLDENNVGNWPKSMKAVVEEIAYRIGVSIDPRTKINVGADYTVPIPTDLTMMQVLGYIGACHGGNWIITEENALRLVPLASAPVARSVTSETPGSTIPQTYYITDEKDLSIGTPEGHNLVWAADGSADPMDGLTNVTAVLGQLTSGAAVTVTGIVMSDNKGHTYTAGNKDGGVITIEGNPYANQTICDILYEKYNGLVYEPYTASKTVYDPATELGDQIIIGDKVHSVLCTAKMVMDLGFRSDISAPNSEALSEEYPYLTDKKKNEVAAKQAAQQTEEKIAGVQAAIPTHTSDLTNDSGFQTRSGVVSIIDGRITADYVEALEIHVAAANITGTLKANQIDASELKVSAANVTGKLTALQIDATDLNVSAANITGTLKANQIDTSELKVSAANITGALTIGQLPDSVATTGDIPTHTSDLTNDSGFQTRSGVVSIIDGRITADYVSGLNCEFTTGKIGSWIIEGEIVRASVGVYGTFSFTTTGTDYRTITGYAFAALTPTGIMYYIQSGSDFENSENLGILNSLILTGASGGSSGGGGVQPL